MKWYNDDEILFTDVEWTEEEVYDPWDDIIDKLDNGEEL